MSKIKWIDQRFYFYHASGGAFSDMKMHILVDSATRVQYLYLTGAGSRSGLTLWVDADGKPILAERLPPDA